MSEKVRQDHNRARSAEQTPGATKQGRYRESWHERKSGLLVPGLGVTATMAGNGNIIVVDRRHRDDDLSQYDEGGSRNLGEEEQQPKNPE